MVKKNFVGAQRSISLTTDKVKYFQGESVAYELKNNGPEPLTIEFDQTEYEVWQKVGGKFKQVQTQDPNWLARAGEKYISPLTLGPGESKKGIWSGVIYDRQGNKLLLHGTFKIVVGSYKSNEFEVAKRSR